MANQCFFVVRFLDLIKPFTPLLPEVAAPETKIPFNQKLMWTGVSSSPTFEHGIPIAEISLYAAHAPHFLDHEPNATLRHCLLGHVRSYVLAADDVGQ